MPFSGGQFFDEDFVQMTQGGPLPVFDGGEQTPTGLLAGGPSPMPVMRTPSDNSFMLQPSYVNFPRDDEIMAAAGLIQAKVNLKDLPQLQSLTEMDPEQKKAIEADPVFKMLEDKFYKVFDQQIVRHTVQIGDVINQFAAERSFVHKKIESIARRELNCDRIVV